MKELWKDIEGYEGIYRISNLGRVYSVRKDIYLKHFIPEDGYHRVDLRVSGIRKKHQVHRLVAKHFCDGFAEGLVANHKDGNKGINEADNLEWCTQLENVRNQIQRGTHNVSVAQKVAQEKNQKPIVVINSNGIEIPYTSTKTACECLNLTPSKVTDVLKGRRKSHKGYSFRYK